MPELLVTCVKALFGQYAHGTTGPLDEVFGGVTCFFYKITPGYLWKCKLFLRGILNNSVSLDECEYQLLIG